jgi:hypothetical protein
MPPTQSSKRARLRELDALLLALRAESNKLPLLTAPRSSARMERNRARLLRGELPEPPPVIGPAPDPRQAHHALERARLLADGTPFERVLGERFDELELEFAILEAIGRPRRLRPLARRRWASAASGGGTDVDVARFAQTVLDQVVPDPEPLSLSARERGDGRSIEKIIRELALWAGFPVDICVHPQLLSKAAAGERTVYLADARFGAREGLRLAVHEVFGHLVSAANARHQPHALLRLGTARSFEDQEGLAVVLEERAGVLDGGRMRTLAARLVASEAFFDGASFGETARLLHRRFGFSTDDALVTAERVHRGGGLPRDAAYLPAYLRVRHAVETGVATISSLQRGRASLAALGALDALESEGLVAPAVYKPSLALSLGATGLGTSFETSPPSFVTSLQSPDAT